MMRLYVCVMQKCDVQKGESVKAEERGGKGRDERRRSKNESESLEGWEVATLVIGKAGSDPASGCFRLTKCFRLKPDSDRQTRRDRDIGYEIVAASRCVSQAVL
jgi:hypothetical protein